MSKLDVGALVAAALKEAGENPAIRPPAQATKFQPAHVRAQQAALVAKLADEEAVRRAMQDAELAAKAEARKVRNRERMRLARLNPKPKAPEPPNRTCLCCGNRFFSEGPHNRMCKRCLSGQDPDHVVAAKKGAATRKDRYGTYYGAKFEEQRAAGVRSGNPAQKKMP